MVRLVSEAAVPSHPIRRFDVFAEYTRQERCEKDYPEDEAKGCGIWLAKVVASRRYGEIGSGDGKKLGKKAERDDAHEAAPTFRSVADELQTDEPIRDTIRRGWKPTRTARREGRIQHQHDSTEWLKG